MRTRAKLVLLELIGALFGWLSMLALIAAVCFFIAAVAFQGPWGSRFAWAAGIAVVANWLARGFMGSLARVAFEADMVAKRFSPEEAGQEWIRRDSRSEIVMAGAGPKEAPPRG